MGRRWMGGRLEAGNGRSCGDLEMLVGLVDWLVG
jgi:hypothetical protein